MVKFNYENKEYAHKLDALDITYYLKYVNSLEKYSKGKNSKILDVGCGTGTVLSILKDRRFTDLYGVDISKLFIKKAKRRKLLNIFHYSGANLPFEDNTFALIGSFNVLEHTDNPEKFIKEQIRKLKPKGCIVIACPNFLSPILPTPHPRIRGTGNRINNFAKILLKMINQNGFEKMEPIIRVNFQYDDDAIIVTNLLDIKRTVKANNCEVIYESGFVNNGSYIRDLIDKFPLLRYMMPSCFLVARKIR